MPAAPRMLVFVVLTWSTISSFVWAQGSPPPIQPLQDRFNPGPPNGGLPAGDSTVQPADQVEFYSVRPGYDLRQTMDFSRLLPAAPDPNYFFSSPFAPLAQLGDGYAVSREVAAVPVFSRLGGTASLGMIYDTGFTDSFTPSGVALDGSSDRRRAGRFQMSGLSDAAVGKLLWDVQAVPNSTSRAQANVELDYVDGELRTRYAFGRLVSGATAVNFGQAVSFAAHNAILPASIIGQVRPVGSLSRERVANFSVTQIVANRIEIGGAIENPGSDFILIDPSNDVKLSRYPTFIGRVRISGENNFDGLQVAALSRGFGLETMAGVEDWAIGWGFSGTARKALNRRNVIYLSASGGEGIGDYIFGAENGAGPISGGLDTIEAYGAFGGLSHLWYQGADDQQLWSNIVIGYSHQDPVDNLMHTADSITQARQAFANVIYRASENVAFGVEYHYLDRRVLDGRSGDNHRIAFVFSVTNAKDPKTPSGYRPSTEDAIPPSGIVVPRDEPGAMYLRSL